MKVIADTSVWSLFLRRNSQNNSQSIEHLRSAIQQRNVQMLGIIRQELLSGIKVESHFRKLSQILDNFPDLLADSTDHSRAAEFFNRCRRKGIQGSPVDFLICAQAHRRRMAILTEDKDFEQYAAHIPIKLIQNNP